MATINQSPAGQASITLSGVSFNDITATATPLHTGSRFTVQGGSFAVSLSFNDITATATPVRTASRFTVQGGSFAVSLGGTETPGPTLPTTGQIWPLGIPVILEPTPAVSSSYGWVWWD